MKIFISHAVRDRDLASKFVDLLQLGIGVARNQIFFSSYAGSIPNAEYFVQSILTELNGSDLVIAKLSRAYFKSEFCLAEAGAALAARERGEVKFYSLVVPPVEFGDLGGVMYARQTGLITTPGALEELRKVFRGLLSMVATIQPGAANQERS